METPQQTIFLTTELAQQEKNLPPLSNLSSQTTDSTHLSHTSCHKENFTFQKSCIFIFVIFYVVFGGVDTIIIKWQNSTIVNGEKFQHPFIQTFLMLISMSLPFYWVIYQKWRGTFKIEKSTSKKDFQSKKSYLILLIPSICDILGSTLQSFCLLFVDTSIYQMMRGGSIIFTAILSKVLFKKVFLKYKYVGLILVIVGLIIVGLSNFLFIGQSQSEQNFQFICLGILCICMALNGCHYTSEEYIYQNYNIHPFQLLGIQAFYGKFIYIILLVIFCNTKCTFPESKGCVKVGEEYYFESVSQFSQNLSLKIVILLLLGMISKCIYNLSGVMTTKHFGSLTRSVAGSLRTMIAWSIGLIVTVSTDEQWENLDLKTNFLKLGGYLVLFLGNLVYNGIISIPCLKDINHILVKKLVPIQIQAKVEEEDQNKFIIKNVQIQIIENERT